MIPDAVVDQLAREATEREPPARRQAVSPSGDAEFDAIAMALGSQIDSLERSLHATRSLLGLFVAAWARRAGPAAVPSEKPQSEAAAELLRRKTRPATFGPKADGGATKETHTP